MPREIKITCDICGDTVDHGDSGEYTMLCIRTLISEAPFNIGVDKEGRNKIDLCERHYNLAWKAQARGFIPIYRVGDHGLLEWDSGVIKQDDERIR